jgi:hypothetical protein
MEMQKENSITKTSGEKNQLKTTERANFMVPFKDTGNVLRKREDFAVSLRKKKTKGILEQKRKRMVQPVLHTDGDSKQTY